jgi:hypothetical protein
MSSGGEAKPMVDVKAPCLCGSGQPAEKCHLDWDGRLRKQMPSLIPPGAITKFSHPSCYLRGTQNCSEDISREHYVSKSVLDQIGSTLRVTGVPWLGVDEALETSVASLTAKILCSRHNETLGPLDQEAALIFGKLRLALTDLDRKTLSRKPILHLVSGEMLELWMLKVACGIFYSVGGVDGQRLSAVSKIDLDKVSRAFFEHRWDERAGLYFRGDIGQGFKVSLDVAVAPLRDPETETYCGVRMALQGMMLDFLFDSSTTGPWPWSGFARRPSELIFERGPRRHGLVLSWPPGTPDIGVRLKHGKGPPRERLSFA